MSSIPYSRYILYPVTWYSFLIFTGAALAIFLAVREEKRIALPKDTIIDLALRILPLGIAGARLYYVLFSWNQFRNNPLSVLKIWEGGLAIYGGVIAGFIVLLLFARKRRISALQLCDLVAPGLALAQSIGRCGNWFNMEAYGLTVTRKALCFFPFAVRIPADGYSWHYATFFYESVWNFGLFLFLMIFRRSHARKTGDVFFFYLFLYAAARLVIEELRLDSLYASSSVRISQLLSLLLCITVMIRYVIVSGNRKHLFSAFRTLLFASAFVFSLIILMYVFSAPFFSDLTTSSVVLMLSAYSLFMIICLFMVYFHYRSPEVCNADNKV